MEKNWIIDEFIRACDDFYNTPITYRSFPTETDHDHCAICWEKFGQGEGQLREGFYQEKTDRWLCWDCFRKIAKVYPVYFKVEG